MTKVERINEVRKAIDELGMRGAAAARWNGYIRAMEEVPADDRWWDDVEDLPVISLVRAVQDILKYDPQWPN